jgi:hypothetical protein
VTGTPPVGGGQRFPALLPSPSGFPPLLLAALAEEVASHGYVVVGINHTYETTVTVFGDGRVVSMNPAALGEALGAAARLLSRSIPGPRRGMPVQGLRPGVRP